MTNSTYRSVLIFLNAIFQGGRLFVGAVCVIYFLSFGFEADQYAWVKTAQGVIFFGLDIPMGYLLSRIGATRSLFLALFLGLAGCLGYLIGGSFILFVCSEVFLALSLSIWPVAFSAVSMHSFTAEESSKGFVDRFYHSGDAIAHSAIVCAGITGGWLYHLDRRLPYVAFGLLYSLGICTMFLLIKRSREIIHQRAVTGSTKNLFGYLPKIWPAIAIIFLIQADASDKKPILIETFISQFPIKTLNVAVLLWFARLYVRPSHPNVSAPGNDCI